MRRLLGRLAALFSAATTSLTPFARKSQTSQRKTQVKRPQRADFLPSTPQESDRLRIYQREPAGSRSPAVWPLSKVRRLSLDGAEDAFLPEVCARAAWSFVASASANAVHARRPRGHRVRLPRPLLRPDTLSPPFGP
jgi:hypothetical protein